MSQRTEQIELVAEGRTVLGKKVRRLRREGWVPGVLYGRGFEPVPLQLHERELARSLQEIGGSQLVVLDIKGQEEPEMVLLREVQRDSIRGNLLHVDFYRVVMTERIRTEVPLVLVGVSPVVEQNLGLVLQGITEVEVECLPGDLVEAIEVDLSDLQVVGQALHVSDLAVPARIDLLSDVSEVIVQAVALAEEEEEEVVEDLLAPEEGEVEVITEARDETESEEAD